MILMWLGSFVLVMFGLSSSQKAAAAVFSSLQKKFLEKGLDVDFKSMLMWSLDLVALEASPQKSLYAGIALYDLRSVSLRAGTLLMCLSTLGAWWILILAFLFMSFNGLFLLGLCSLGFLSALMTAKIEKVLRWIFATGIFLLGGEIMLRNSSILQSTFGESDLIFFLADGRFPSVIGLLIVGVVVSFVVQIEFWSLALALSLLFTNMLSLNGALGLLVGERLGRMILFWWHTRKLSMDSRKIAAQFSWASCAGVIVGLLVAGEVRETIYLGYSNGMASFQDKSLQFVMLFIVILFFQFVAQMIWGHFAAQIDVTKSDSSKTLPPAWFRSEYSSAAWKNIVKE